jgi:mRNA N6-methyladenine demethylase
MGRNRNRKRRLRQIMSSESTKSASLVRNSKRKDTNTTESSVSVSSSGSSQSFSRQKHTQKWRKKTKLNDDTKKQQINNFDYKSRTRVLPKPYAISRKQKNFLTPQHADFDAVLKVAYPGFCVDEESKFPQRFHDDFASVFDLLENDNIFLYDVTQPRGLGTPCARTFVQRTLLGEPGTTYKYLGLRMFSIPWTAGSPYHLMERLNGDLIERTKLHLASSVSTSEPAGPCHYNLTLINRMSPLSEIKAELKDEPMFQKEKCSVSWHADSTLQHYSSIAVYHLTEDDIPSAMTKPWKIGLRVLHYAEGPSAGNKSTEESVTPAVSLPLPNRSTYYMMDDFNHHHQHAVIAGGTRRYASTHRVCKELGHTVQSVIEKCESVIRRAGKRHTLKQWRSEQSLLDEVEFEWIRQWYVQGQRHADMRAEFWNDKIARLVEMWRELESRTYAAFELLRHAVEPLPEHPTATADEQKSARRKFLKKQKKARLALKEKHQLDHIRAFDLLIACFTERAQKRVQWKLRYTDPAFQKVAQDCQPIPLPIFDGHGPEKQDSDWQSLGESLRTYIAKLNDYRGRYEEV